MTQQMWGSFRYPVPSQKLPADSLHELEVPPSRWVIHPEAHALAGWKVFQALLLLYVAAVTPYRLAFVEDCDPVGQVVFDLVLDILFLVDLPVNMLTGFFVGAHYEGRVKEVLKHYFRAAFWMDCVMSLPVAWIEFSLIGGACGATTVQVLRLPRLLRMLRILRILRVVQIFMLPSMKRLRGTDPNLIRLVKLLLAMACITHFVACGWWTVKELDSDLADFKVEQGFDGNESPLSFYVLSLYYVVTTLTTVGYGDIHGVNNAERVNRGHPF